MEIIDWVGDTKRKIYNAMIDCRDSDKDKNKKLYDLYQELKTGQIDHIEAMEQFEIINSNI